MSPSILLLLFLQLIFQLNYVSGEDLTELTRASYTEKRTKAFTILLSCLQCISDTDSATAEIREIRRSFDPQRNRHKYRNRTSLDKLLRHVRENENNPSSTTEPFTYTTENIANLQIILDPLYYNTHNWGLFYNTSAWLLGRVNGAQLFWAIKIVAAEKFSGTVVTASAAEVFPQLFIDKGEVQRVASNVMLQSNRQSQRGSQHPLHYWMSDPGLNEFRLNWNVENPYWWNPQKYGVTRDRQGELFFFMHHQILNRMNSELASNGLPNVTRLEYIPEYMFPEPYYPDVVNVNFQEFHPRVEGELMGDLDDGQSLSNLSTFYTHIEESAILGYMYRDDGSIEVLRLGLNATLPASVGAITPFNNESYYGAFHNPAHKYLGYLNQAGNSIPGVEALVETSMRDMAFYRLHESIAQLQIHVEESVGPEPHTGCIMNFENVTIDSVTIQTNDNVQTTPPYVFTTYMGNTSVDISTVARPCQGIGGPPAYVNVTTLQYDHFNYTISITSQRVNVSHGTVRIFLLPEVDHTGQQLDTEVSHYNSIMLDIFNIALQPGETRIIQRPSTNSSVTRRPIPGIKELYNARSPSPNGILKNDQKRACGFPNNLLLPRGTPEGLNFTLFVMVSELADDEFLEEQHHFAYCGHLNGLPLPESHVLGFPFEFPGTTFTSYDGYAYKNIMQTPILIKHNAVV